MSWLRRNGHRIFMVVFAVSQFSILYFYFKREEALPVLLYAIAFTLLILLIAAAVLRWRRR